MSLLPVPSEDELSSEARAELARARAADEPVSSLDMVLLGHVPSYRAYRGFEVLHGELVPFIGERATTLFAHAIVSAAGSVSLTAAYREALVEAGDDPDAAQVTETERLLLEWGNRLGAGPSSIDAEFTVRMQRAFNPRLRLILLAFAGQLLARAVVNDAAGLG